MGLGRSSRANDRALDRSLFKVTDRASGGRCDEATSEDIEDVEKVGKGL